MQHAVFAPSVGAFLQVAASNLTATAWYRKGSTAPLIDYDDSATIKGGLAEVLAATGGTLDVLYNNGAFACPAAVEDLPRDAMRAIFETNLFGYHELTNLVIPVIRAQNHGRIINCSSVLGSLG